ncbi:hypothetical protein TSUD_263180 [Trifolium subterraneum]|nr:hypothetical protein TSUD_263180 [Trifolium subterraneum]
MLLHPRNPCESLCMKLFLNIDDTEPSKHPTYYYDTKYTTNGYFSKNKGSLLRPRQLIALDPRKGVVGFVKRETLYGVEDDLKVKPLSANSFLSYLKESSLSFDDLEVKVISIGEAEALKFLGVFLTSKFTLTSGLQDFLNVPKQESTLTSNFSLCFQQELEDLAVPVFYELKS